LYLDELYEKIGWPLYKKYGHAYDAFKLVLADETDPFTELDVPESIKDELKAYIKRRLAPQPIKIRADIEVSCFTYEGIDAIREALFAGMAVGGEKTPIKINLIAPPIYVLSTMALEKEAGIELLNKAIETIQESITSKGGKMEIKMAAKAVSVKEETELQAILSISPSIILWFSKDISDKVTASIFVQSFDFSISAQILLKFLHISTS